VPQVSGLEMAGVCLPAIGIGGDYYDFLPLSGERVGLVIADVSGKGIPAALLMAGLQSAVRGLVLPTIPAADMTRRLNEVLYRSTSAARYATLFFGIYDGRERLLTYSNAGHNPPLQITSNGTVRLSSGGIPLGVLGDTTYEQGARSLDSGDILALYTDGVTEARSLSGDEFGEERLIDLLLRHRRKPIDDLIRVVLDELTQWVAGSPPHDDLTLVLARAV
jgi:sigma-B regulation protein RsbU (phosphoserine phosphatase)